MRKVPFAILKRRAPGALMMLALALGACAALRPSIRGNDGVGHYVYLASLLRGGDLDFTDEYSDFDTLRHYPFRFAQLPRHPATGLPGNRYGIGSALLWAPFAAVTHLSLLHVAPQDATTLTRPYEWAIGAGTAFWGSLGLWLIFDRLRRRWGAGAAAATVAGLLLATPLGFYLYAHGSMSHGASFFAAAGLALAFEQAWRRPGPRAMALCGFWAGLLVMIRVQDATWALAVGLALCARVFTPARAPRTGKCLGVIAFGLTAFLVFLPQMAVWRLLYGSWLAGPAPYLNDSAGSFSPWPVHALDVLVSERGGVLAWHPLMALGLIGLIALARASRRLRPLAVAGLAGFALQVWLIACWSMWWGGASFGNRFFISALPWLAFGLSGFVSPGRAARARGVAFVVLALLIVWNMGLLFQYATQMTPREDAIPWTRVIRQNMIDVPTEIMRRLAD